MTVVFIIAMSVLNLLLVDYLAPQKNADKNFLAENSAYFGAAAVEGGNPIDSELRGDGQETKFIIVDSASILNANNPLSNALPTREGLIIYKVQKGDNLSRIAANFGISLNTIFWANENLKPTLLQPGQEILILPVTGILHQVRDGETLESIAVNYNIAVDKILSANPNFNPVKFSAGSTIIIPNSKPASRSSLVSAANLPNFPGYFAIPTTGWNWGQLHYNNAVDIANACGTPTYASAEGLVVEESSYGWNQGYGKYILIEHPNGVKTKYSHTGKNEVLVGDYVVKGDLIGYIGNTGNTHGPTGCHLHFEVIGARNPFAK
ncbi:MAG: hypothetical protein A3B92_04225 [Candidatus Harrisonbacteria bacterium RIFCSPHIGHO2_02_FULL_42_16]|uniref:LysM domain-containing protein n=1 Tax=Candidatus Harrisonbacteria bacterium RIFCSPHIGHO2_02_FULL_42_16 TaxID=1798404 RepID=A0A1G1ZHD9_9BACT|nr:MAG: hypothetical protein A3B92_04225 [Candidatus Harrisonbacteria bacterium RIFCSPHIGHO2_02_FULL_42_16]